jgi:hypothetical protein
MSGAPTAPSLGASPAKLRSLMRLVPNGRGKDERAFLPAALEIIETPASPVGRAIGFLIVAAAVTAATWASLSKIDIITTAPGRIVPIGRSKIIRLWCKFWTGCSLVMFELFFMRRAQPSIWRLRIWSEFEVC